MTTGPYIRKTKQGRPYGPAENRQRGGGQNRLPKWAKIGCQSPGTMDDRKFEILEIIVDNAQGLIVERVIALRPYPKLKLFRDAMYTSLNDKLPPDVWDYPTP
jgi:hypothetical protein